jgi:hypothetical protein
MFLEYANLLGSMDTPLSIGFFTRVLSSIFCGLLLVFVGYKLKGMWGALVFLAGGVLVFLYSEGVIGFRV